MSDTRPIQIGVLYSQTGVTASVETTQMQATLLAIDEVNQRGGVLGRELVPICLDPASQPRRCASLSEQLILQHGVRLIMGCYMSSTRKAVIPIAERHNALLFYATPYEGFEYSRNVFYAGAAPNQNILPLAGYMLSRHGRRVAMVGSDYVCPYEANRVMSDLIYEHGGQKALEAYLPLDADVASCDSVAASIQASGVDFVFSSVVGAGATLLHRALARIGLDPSRLPIASHMASETDVALIGPEFVEGLITCASYFQSIDTAVNRNAVTRHQARVGVAASTNACWEAAYFQMHLLARAIDQAGSDDPTRIALALPGLVFDAPQGRVRVDAHNNHTDLNPRIGRCDRHGQFEILASAPLAVPADPYDMSHQAPGWTQLSVATLRPNADTVPVGRSS